MGQGVTGTNNAILKNSYSLSDRRHRLRHQRIKAFSQFFLELVDQTLRGLQTSFSEGRALEKDLCPIGKAAYVHPAAMPVAEPL